MESVLEPTRTFWGDALDLEPIRVVDSRLARTTGRAFVLHHTIYWPGAVPHDPDLASRATLIHELAHCWQYQSGQWQAARGCIEQTGYTLLGLPFIKLGARAVYDPYDYGGPAGLRATDRLESLRLEAQAKVIEHYWLASVARVPAIGGAALTTGEGDPTPLAEDLARLCRGAGIP